MSTYRNMGIAVSKIISGHEREFYMEYKKDDISEYEYLFKEYFYPKDVKEIYQRKLNLVSSKPFLPYIYKQYPQSKHSAISFKIIVNLDRKVKTWIFPISEEINHNWADLLKDEDFRTFIKLCIYMEKNLPTKDTKLSSLM